MTERCWWSTHQKGRIGGGAALASGGFDEGEVAWSGP
jgi:hypothetical protein